MLLQEDMRRLMKKFMDIYRDDEHSRYRSYDYAHKIFLDNRKSNDDKTLDYVALNLFAFLGSWGMVARGSLFMKKDYRFFIPVVKLLNDERYDKLVDFDPYTTNVDDDKIIELLIDVTDKLREYFEQGKTYYNIKGPIEGGAHLTDTAIGKILMVTLGCLPAYDTYVVIGLKAVGVCVTVGKKSFRELLLYCRKHTELKDILNDVNEQTKATSGVEYPIMKLIDMITWEYGYEIDEVIIKR